MQINSSYDEMSERKKNPVFISEQINPDVQSTYIHIPFCKKKCGYCSFLSYEDLELKNIYLDALLKEIKEGYDGMPQKTLYVGGGTPSLLSLGDFEEIFGCFKFEQEAEITVEINPDGIEREYLAGLFKLGVNRLSIGVQSFDNKILQTIGRGHCAQNSIRTLKRARNAGFKNISIDLMYGLPGQDLNGWEQTLNQALELMPEHISLYGLKIDKGCYFYKNKPKNLPDGAIWEDLQADMYLAAIKILNEAGYCQYEISNFAKSAEYFGRHNLNYWQLGCYWGFGVGASGFTPLNGDYGGRYINVKNIEKYIKNPNQKIWEKTSLKNLLEEEIFLGFRLIEGLNVNAINKKYRIDFEKKYELILKKFIDSGHIIKTKNGYKLSIEGILVSNLILCEFI